MGRARDKIEVDEGSNGLELFAREMVTQSVERKMASVSIQRN